MDEKKQPLLRADPKLFWWTLSLISAIGITFLLVVGIAGWGIYRDFRQVRETLIDSEAKRLRTHAERTVRIIAKMQAQNKTSDVRDPAILDYLRRHWDTAIPNDDSRMYAAIVGLDDTVLVHFNPQLEGKRLSQTWYERTVPEAGDDVVDTKSEALTGGQRVLDVRVPMQWNDQAAGAYHSGLTYAWVERELEDKKHALWRTWGLILCVMLVVLTGACWALLQISRRLTMMREAMKLARSRRYAEVGQLMSGIVHEIRNPLNAMRLNLHVIEQMLVSANKGVVAPPASMSEQSLIIQESIQEIDRVEGLMRMLLGYVRPESPQIQPVDVRREMESTLLFLRPILERSEIAVTARFPEKNSLIRIDRDRFRQIVINLLNNAIEATGAGGHIQIGVRFDRDTVEISVSDDGPGILWTDRERVFEPFYSTKENGNGLGLALVRRYVEEVGGLIYYERNEPRGARFTMRFPVESAEISLPITPNAMIYPLKNR